MSFVLGVTLSFVAAFSWGLAHIFFKLGVNRTRAVVATFIKGLVAIPLLLIIGYAIYGSKPFLALFRPDTLPFLFLAATSLALGDGLSLLALKKANVSIVQPITTIYPLFSTLILLLAGIELITWQIILGTVLITIGVGVVSYFSSRNQKNSLNNNESQTELAKEDTTSNSVSMVGIILSILAAVSWGATIVFTRMLVYAEGTNVIVIMGVRNIIMVTGAFLVAIIHPLITTRKFPRDLWPPKYSIINLILGGLVAWGIGGVAFFTAVGMIGAAISTPISSISPIVVLILSAIWLKEKINRSIIIGVLLVVGGSIALTL